MKQKNIIINEKSSALPVPRRAAEIEGKFSCFLLPKIISTIRLSHFKPHTLKSYFKKTMKQFHESFE
jgi:hypothetical protein